ncbi:NRG1 [Candida margitis]|uniref:NRG1 n=1 Tax=Candida margitis TaxID=1775924 RepID=UPI0022275424|nr:NRG1 [Candida margitis]KAI5970798.1 NRG1 [Candida margitis]
MMVSEQRHFTLVSTNAVPNGSTTNSNSNNMLLANEATYHHDRSEPKSTALPSFSELLTSIPLPTAFKSRSNSNVSATSVNTSNSSSYTGLSSQQQQQQQQQQHQSMHRPTPYSYYSQPSVQHRLPTPPPHNHQQNTPQQVQDYQQQQQYSYQYQVIGTKRTAFIAPQPVASHRSSNIDPLTPVSVSIDTKARSSSICDIPISPAIGTRSATSPYTQHQLQQQARLQQTSPLQASTTTTSSATSPILINHVTKDSRRKHVCKVCARSFTTSGHLARHNRIHTGERKHKCPWPTCDARFARQDNCMQHYKTHTNGKNKRRARKYVNQVQYGEASVTSLDIDAHDSASALSSSSSSSSSTGFGHHHHVVSMPQGARVLPNVSHLTR